MGTAGNGSVLVAGDPLPLSDIVEVPPHQTAPPVYIPLNPGTFTEVYSTAAGMWTVVGNLTRPRTRFQVVKLPSGRVLAASGIIGDSEGGDNTSELYNPATLQWSLTGSLHEARTQYGMVLLPTTGKALVVGGFGDFLPSHPGTTLLNFPGSELYDEATGEWYAFKNPPCMSCVGSPCNARVARMLDSRVPVLTAGPKPPAPRSSGAVSTSR